MTAIGTAPVLTRSDGDDLGLQRKAAMVRLMRKHRGTITPEAVIKEAESEDSPLHDLFEWDDSEAARRFRLDQARSVIRRFTVYVTASKHDPMNVRVDIRPPLGAEDDTRLTRGIRHVDGKYRALDAVLNDADLRAQMVAQAKAELRNVRQRYRECTELSAVWDSIDRLDARAVA